MKINLEKIKNNYKSLKRRKILGDFYTESIKKGKKTTADRLDFLGISLITTILMAFIINAFIDDFILVFILTFLISSISSVYVIKYRKKIKSKKIMEVQEALKKRLKEEKIDLPNDNIEEYIVNKHLEERSKIKGSFKFSSKNKIMKLYFLCILFLLISYFSSYPKYYKIMSIICFIIATIIGSYNFTEYIRLKDKKTLIK